MREHIFTNDERRILEELLTNSKVNQAEASEILQKIKERKTLFEDIYLYLNIFKRYIKVESPS
jgi:hypothetical protein